jgi:putative flippase GtrA
LTVLYSSGLINSAEARRFARFLAVGLLNTAFGYALYAGGLFLGLRPEVALLVATVLGVCFNFLTTGRLVFADRDQNRIVRFVLAYAVSYLFNVAMLRGLLAVGASPLVAQALVLPLMVVLTFVLMRAFVFRERKR